LPVEREVVQNQRRTRRREREDGVGVVLRAPAVDEEEIEGGVCGKYVAPVAAQDVDVRVVREELAGRPGEALVGLSGESGIPGGRADASQAVPTPTPVPISATRSIPRRAARMWSSIPSSSRQLLSNPSASAAAFARATSGGSVTVWRRRPRRSS
jgi:hypothetical protein